MSKELAAAIESLKRVQEFDVRTLPQTEKLGTALDFKDAVEPANRVIALFRQLSVDHLSDFPDSYLTPIREHADGFFQILNEILSFDPSQGSAHEIRNAKINDLKKRYSNYFEKLFNYISYSATRERDFSSLENSARASIQRYQDDAEKVKLELSQTQQAAAQILEDIRKVAAEQGVSQQSIYFKQEADRHDELASKWQLRVIRVSILIGVFAVLSIFIHKIPWISPANLYETIQLTTGKVILFFVLAYVMILFARNFLSHKHNAIVNRQRQNGLLTFKALVDAAGSEEKRDIVLTYAAASIFAPQDTGYSKGASHTEMPSSIIQALPKLGSGAST